MNLLGGLGAALNTNSHEGDPGTTVLKCSLGGEVASDTSCPWAALCYNLGP